MTDGAGQAPLSVEFAPLEGVTKAVFRRIHRRMFSGVARYYSPFLSPTGDGFFSQKELREILPENNEDVPLVPQLLTARAEHFRWAARELRAMGYQTVNLNLGCPSGTVVSKHKGAGALGDPEGLRELLWGVFDSAEQEGVRVSVKTRIGLENAEIWPELLEIYNDFPLEELIIHPRTGRQLYRGAPDLGAFARALERLKAPVCYNGDLFTLSGIDAFRAAFPTVKTVMLGRGLAANPALARQAAGGAPLASAELKAFHDALLADYALRVQGDGNVLARMKELWEYFSAMLPDCARPLKALRKTKTLAEYRAAAAALFAQCPVDPARGFCPPANGGTHF